MTISGEFGLEAKERILNSKNPYHCLNLPTSASPEESKYQYFKLVKRFSPEKEEEAFRKIRKAYEDIRDPARKASVDVMLFRGAAGRVRFSGVNTAAVSQVKLNREIDAIRETSEDPDQPTKRLALTFNFIEIIFIHFS